MSENPYPNWAREQVQAAWAERDAQLKYEYELKQAIEAEARRKAQQREQAFLDRVKRRRGPMTIAYGWERLRERPELRAEVQHVRVLASRLGVRMVVCAGANDGSASGDDPIVAIPALTSRFAIATALHELGHKANPCGPGHRRRTSRNGDSVCARCEINAWVWARANTYGGLWWSEQAENLKRALNSYRDFATVAELFEIDEVCAGKPTPFAQHRLRLLEKCR